MIGDIIKKHPHLKGHEDLIQFVIDLRKAFNTKENFRITIGDKVIGHVKERVIKPLPKPRRYGRYKKRQIR